MAENGRKSNEINRLAPVISSFQTAWTLCRPSPLFLRPTLNASLPAFWREVRLLAAAEGTTGARISGALHSGNAGRSAACRPARIPNRRAAPRRRARRWPCQRCFRGKFEGDDPVADHPAWAVL